MFRKLGILAVLLILFCGVAFADFGDEATIGGQDGDNVYRWRVNSTAMFPGVNDTYNIGEPTHQVNAIYSKATSVGNLTYYKNNVESFATGDTLLATESGKVCITTLYDTDGYVNFTLPNASIGLTYTFIAGNQSYVGIDPASADKIMFLTLSNGDTLLSSGEIGDSVTLTAFGANRWVIQSMSPGNWTDGT